MAVKKKKTTSTTTRRRRRVYSRMNIMDALQKGALIVTGLFLGGYLGNMIPIADTKIKAGLTTVLGFMGAASKFARNQMVKMVLLGIGTIGMYSLVKDLVGLSALSGECLGIPISNMSGQLGIPISNTMDGGRMEAMAPYWLNSTDI